MPSSALPAASVGGTIECFVAHRYSPEDEGFDVCHVVVKIPGVACRQHQPEQGKTMNITAANTPACAPLQPTKSFLGFGRRS